MLIRKILLPICFSLIIILLPLLSSCKEEITEKNNTIRPDIYSGLIIQMNQDIADMQQMMEGNRSVQIYTKNTDGSYSFELNNNHSFTVYPQKENNLSSVPVIGIDSIGYWIYYLNGITAPLTTLNNSQAPALSKLGKGIYTPIFRINNQQSWDVSFNGKQWKTLNAHQSYKSYSVDTIASPQFSPFASCQEDLDNNTVTLVMRCGGRRVTLPVIGKSETPAWKDFKLKSDKNILLDFSYAGYMHGEIAPPKVNYPYVNVQERMRTKQLTARQALLDIMKEYKLDKGNPLANIVIYFPAGKYVLHNENDNIKKSDKAVGDKDSKGNNTSEAITLLGGNFVIKGDGVDKTQLIMETPNLPDNNNLYSSPNMIMIKNNVGLKNPRNVTGTAEKGSFSVTVDDASSFKKGDWVCLYLHDNNPNLVKKELLPYTLISSMTNLSSEGVQVEDYHQIASIEGNTITFIEPIMHEITQEGNWTLQEFRHYENVGVEDLTFVGNAKNDFKHHGSWQDDGAYKPISFMRMTNSWMRRVNFHSVSEASSIVSCANFSAYSITIDGNRGHSAIRSQGSSRVFIGKVKDISAGKSVETGIYITDAGQYHAVGVSKPSMGAVIWRCNWGNDACFESHATQPRATLIDCCTGGFMQSRQGGDLTQLPNHLNDLTIWNFSATNSPKNTDFDWWSKTSVWWKFLPPIIVGFHGTKTNFIQEQVKLDEGNGTIVEPQSLYEAQLKLRLGYVPDWLKALK